MTIRKILVAFDLSEPAGRALRWAHDLGQAAGATLEVVHVHPDIYEERYVRFLEQEVKTAVAALLSPLDRETPVHLVRGDPVKRILAVAEQIPADLVCMGSTGKGGVHRVLLGSVSEYVLRSSHVPVLIVH